MVSEKYFRAAVVVCIEQAGDEGSECVDEHDRENRYRKTSASAVHDETRRTIQALKHKE